MSLVATVNNLVFSAKISSSLHDKHLMNLSTKMIHIMNSIKAKLEQNETIRGVNIAITSIDQFYDSNLEKELRHQRTSQLGSQRVSSLDEMFHKFNIWYLGDDATLFDFSDDTLKQKLYKYNQQGNKYYVINQDSNPYKWLIHGLRPAKAKDIISLINAYINNLEINIMNKE